MMEGRPREFADIPTSHQEMTRAELERIALVIAPGSSGDQGRSIARAKAELALRDREYAEEQERSRREFEREMSAAADAREADRQKFDEALAQRQMDRASKLARDQLRTAQAAARAAIAAAIAAFLSVAVAAVTAFPTIEAAWFPQTTAAQAPSSGATPTTHQ